MGGEGLGRRCKTITSDFYARMMRYECHCILLLPCLPCMNVIVFWCCFVCLVWMSLLFGVVLFALYECHCILMLFSFPCMDVIVFWCCFLCLVWMSLYFDVVLFALYECHCVLMLFSLPCMNVIVFCCCFVCLARNLLSICFIICSRFI